MKDGDEKNFQKLQSTYLNFIHKAAKARSIS